MGIDNKKEFPGFSIRYNILPVNSIKSFAGIRGGNNHGCKDVYFMRCIGSNSSYIKDIQEMDRFLEERSKCGQGNYLRIRELPVLSDHSRILKYTELLNEWRGNEGNGVKLEVLKQGLLSEDIFHGAFRRIEEEFIRYSPNTTESIIRNFLIKIIFWTDSVFDSLLKGWNGKNTDKLVYTGNVKKQEYLFFYFLTIFGIDVMVLLPEGEPGIDHGLLSLSGKISLEKLGPCQIPEYQKTESQPQCSAAAFTSESPDRPGLIPVRRPGDSKTTESSVRLKIPERSVNSGTPGNAEPTVSRNHRGIQREQGKRAELEFEELARLASSVVMITIYDNKGNRMGSGSGIMIGEGGYILTNNHVAVGGVSYSVSIEEEEKAYWTDEVIKWNSVLDLAVIRIPRRLQPIPLYYSGEPLVRGQKVVAIGSPLGLFNSVSNGIISGFREIRDVEMIQFTAPISHGSSGGALLNMFGEIIGICTAGFDGGQNINLAVDYRNISRFAAGFM